MKFGSLKKRTPLNKCLFAFFFCFILVSFQKDKPAYLLYNESGKRVKYNKALCDLVKADVILFGEYHDNPISHWLQLELAKDLHVKSSLMLGGEMFEVDNQDELDEYMKSTSIQIDEIDSIRLWPNYATDYAPLVEFAKSNQLKFVCTNVPRRTARIVYKEGFAALDELSKLEKSYVAKLPIAYDPDLPGYKAMLSMMGGNHSNEKLPMAQALKDATMAEFILKNRGDKLFLHFNGSYHSNNFEGIYWYLKNADPELKIKTIATVSQANVRALENENMGIANYIIAVPGSMTSTH